MNAPRVYVDDSRIPATVGRIKGRWSHLTADTDEALHAFAARLGLRREWFQDAVVPEMRHYDVTESKRQEAIRLGAVEETWREAAKRALASMEARSDPAGSAT